MTNQEITLAKFHACMRNSILKYGVFESSTKKNYKDDFQEFNKICIKHDLEEYSELLFKYFLDILELNSLNYKSHYSHFESIRERDEYSLALFETILFLHRNQYNETKSISIYKSRLSHPIKNERLIFELEEYLQQLSNRILKTMYSQEEAENELKEKKNQSWVANWMKENISLDIKNRKVLYKDIVDDQNYLPRLANEYLSWVKLKIEINKSFRWNNAKIIELSDEMLEETILQIKNSLTKKPGAPPKNQNLTVLAIFLKDLVRIEQFLITSDITDIDQIKIKAKNYRSIYEILDFWGFIPEREEDNTSTADKYLTTVIKQTVKHLPFNINSTRKERFTVLKQKLSPFIST